MKNNKQEPKTIPVAYRKGWQDANQDNFNFEEEDTNSIWEYIPSPLEIYKY